MKRVNDYTHQRFGRLLIIEQFISGGHSTARCICDCGKTKLIGVCDLIRGKTQSCGCLQKERTSKAVLKHGDRKRNTKEYTAWCLMKARCNPLNKNNPEYKNWAGRGITVSARWLRSYENFLYDIGRAPSPKLSLDRINNEGNYEPGNCRWATAKEQANNSRPKTKRIKSIPV